MGYSVEQIQELLLNTKNQWGYSGWDFWYEECYEPVALTPDLDAEVIVKGGPTGYDYEVWFVIKVSGLDGTERFFRKNGYYNSYEGHEWDGSFDEVFPQTKTVTIYEKG